MDLYFAAVVAKQENGYKIPGQAHLSKNLTNFKESNKLEIIGEIMSGKEGDEKN